MHVGRRRIVRHKWAGISARRGFDDQECVYAYARHGPFGVFLAISQGPARARQVQHAIKSAQAACMAEALTVRRIVMLLMNECRSACTIARGRRCISALDRFCINTFIVTAAVFSMLCRGADRCSCATRI